MNTIIFITGVIENLLRLLIKKRVITKAEAKKILIVKGTKLLKYNQEDILK